MDKPYKIFISYCDDEIAREIYKHLKDNEFVAWIDYKEVLKDAGREFNPTIFKAIEEAAYFVVLLGKSALENKYVMDELNAAHEVARKTGKEDFVQYMILDLETHKAGVTLSDGTHISFTDWKKGIQAFLYFLDPEKAKSDLSEFFSIKMDKPMFKDQEDSRLMREYRFAVGRETRIIRFVTAYLADIMYEVGHPKNIKVRVNLFDYRKKYRYSVAGVNYRIDFYVTFNLWLGTIKKIEYKIKNTLL